MALQESLRVEIQAEVRQALARHATRKALPKGTGELHISHKGLPFSLAWSPNGELLAMTIGGEVAIWALNCIRSCGKLKSEQRTFRMLDFSMALGK